MSNDELAKVLNESLRLYEQVQEAERCQFEQVPGESKRLEEASHARTESLVSHFVGAQGQGAC